MTTILSLILVIIFIGLSGIHFYWLFGGKWGLDKAIPTNPEKGQLSFEPPPFATALVGLALMSCALLYLAKSGFLVLPVADKVITYGAWIIPGAFILRAIGEFNYVGLFKKIKGTPFAEADSKVFVPLCMLIGLLGLLVNWL